MTIVITVIITLFVYWTIGLIIAAISENMAMYWAVGLVYPIAMFIFYPIRAIATYNKSSHYYEKHGITKLQYLFGKRVHTKEK